MMNNNKGEGGGRSQLPSLRGRRYGNLEIFLGVVKVSYQIRGGITGLCRN